MNSSGDAAEQIVRMSLEGTEVALRLTGSAAKNIAAALYAVLKNRDKGKIKGHQRLAAMLKSGRELKVFGIHQENLKQFTLEARRYGVVYCALRRRGKAEDGLVDIMVRAEDAAKINRIVERFQMATVDTASIKQDMEQGKGEKAEDPALQEHTGLDKDTEDALLDEMMGGPAGKEESSGPNPLTAEMEKSPPSEPTSKKHDRAGGGTAENAGRRASVREELKEIKALRQKGTDRQRSAEISHSSRKPQQKGLRHKQPGQGRKKRKPKGRETI